MQQVKIVKNNNLREVYSCYVIDTAAIVIWDRLVPIFARWLLLNIYTSAP